MVFILTQCFKTNFENKHNTELDCLVADSQVYSFPFFSDKMHAYTHLHSQSHYTHTLTHIYIHIQSDCTSTFTLNLILPAHPVPTPCFLTPSSVSRTRQPVHQSQSQQQRMHGRQGSPGSDPSPSFPSPLSVVPWDERKWETIKCRFPGVN